MSCAERERLLAYRTRRAQWKLWGPYLSERSWGTVREDYSADGNAWAYFPHDQARSRAYRWGEDGLGGWSDRNQYLCFAPAFWNGKDPILKERFFGVSNSEGNHGEDVKEIYYFLDGAPTHSYMRMLYKYPQNEFPYWMLVEQSMRRSKKEPEFEIFDTGIFDANAYFDCTIEYAKASDMDTLIEISVRNMGGAPAPIWVSPHLWFRNTWSWGYPEGPMSDVPQRPLISFSKDKPSGSYSAVTAHHAVLGDYYLYADHSLAAPQWLFTENESNEEKLFGRKNNQPYVKYAFHR
jgi:hypothetical protein